MVGGPLAGQRIVIVDELKLKREVVHLPRPLPGVPEFVAVTEAELEANELLPQVLTDLVDEGPAKWQKDATLIVEMRAAAESEPVEARRG